MKNLRHVQVEMSLRNGERARFGVEGTWEQIFRILSDKATDYDPFSITIRDEQYVETCSCGPDSGCHLCTSAANSAERIEG